MLATRLTEMLKVKHPIMLAGMAGVSYAELTAAMSEAGGYGVLGAGNMSIEEMSAEMVKVRQLTSRPFGIDLLAPNTNKPEEEARRIIDGGASCLVTDVDMPSKVIRLCREAGVLVFYVCSTVRHAILAEQAGCDAIIAQGTEAGGHTGAVGTMALVPQVVDNVKVPVIAAGGIYDGRGLAAALALGGEGVWVGTRFVACAEARGADAYKDAILRQRKRYDPLALLDRQAAAGAQESHDRAMGGEPARNPPLSTARGDDAASRAAGIFVSGRRAARSPFVVLSGRPRVWRDHEDRLMPLDRRSDDATSGRSFDGTGPASALGVEHNLAPGEMRRSS